MIAANYSEFRTDLKKYLDCVEDNNETLIIKEKLEREPLKFDLAGFWSGRIDQEHRLVYQVLDNKLRIIACRYHYDKNNEAQQLEDE